MTTDRFTVIDDRSRADLKLLYVYFCHANDTAGLQRDVTYVFYG